MVFFVRFHLSASDLTDFLGFFFGDGSIAGDLLDFLIDLGNAGLELCADLASFVSIDLLFGDVLFEALASFVRALSDLLFEGIGLHGELVVLFFVLPLAIRFLLMSRCPFRGGGSECGGREGGEGEGEGERGEDTVHEVDSLG